jgi:hypothetical protein
MLLVRVPALDQKKLLVALVEFPSEELFPQNLEVMLMKSWKVLENFWVLGVVELEGEVVNHVLIVMELGEVVAVFVSFQLLVIS